MKESMTYQKILADGKAEGLAEGRVEGRVEVRTEGERELFLRLAVRHLGVPDDETLATVHAATAETITRWADRLFDAADWSELLKD